MDRSLHDGRQDGLEPLEPLDVAGADGLPDLLRKMSGTAFGGRALGEAYHVLNAMADDPECTVVVTLSGAMTIAKMGRVLCEMIENDLADILISTGALMAHGLSEGMGNVHYKHDPDQDDLELFKKGYNRVYDTLEMEANLEDTQNMIYEVLASMDLTQPSCSFEINRAIGKRMVEQNQMPSVLGSAYRKGVKVYVPAFTDSELGLDMAVYMMEHYYKEHPGASLSDLLKQIAPFNPFKDLNDYAAILQGAKRLAIFTIGGGVPRNWAQQIGPAIDNINMRLGLNVDVPRFQYGIRICPEPTHWGGLSGCTYSEGISWGKFVPPSEGGRFAEVYCDATIAWPILIRAFLEERGIS